MYKGITLLAVACTAVLAQAQTLEERAKAHGFFFDVSEYEQHKILAKDDSSPFYMRLDEKWSEATSNDLLDYFYDRGERAAADEALKEIEELMPDIWAVTTRPRYYLAGDWSNWISLPMPHLDLSRKVMRLHRVLIKMAAEDGRHEDVLKSLVAIRTLANHARDFPGELGSIVAINFEGSMNLSIANAAEQFSEDIEGIRLLRNFTASIQEQPLMEGLKSQVPLNLGIIDQLIKGKISFSEFAGPGFDETSSIDGLLPFANYQNPLRDRYLSIILEFADAWGDQRAADRVGDELEESLAEDSEDLAVILPNMVMSVLLVSYSNFHASEQRARVRTRITKIGLAAMELRLKNGEWPTLDSATKFAQVSAADPFGSLLHYVPSSDSLLIYSVGRDMVDDGGARRTDPDQTYDNPTVTFRLKK